MRSRTVLRSAMLLQLSISRIVILSLRESRLRNFRSSIAIKVINPIPPIWISNSMTIWPNRVKSSATTTGVRPVTQVALVDKNNALIQPIPSPVEETGRASRTVPTRITAKKLMETLRGAVKKELKLRLG